MNLEVTLLLNGMNRTLLLPSANKLTNKKTRPVRFHPHEVLRVISVKETGSGRQGDRGREWEGSQWFVQSEP